MGNTYKIASQYAEELYNLNMYSKSQEQYDK